MPYAHLSNISILQTKMASAPGVPLQPSNQYDSGTCTRQALGKCIKAAGDKLDPKMDFDQDSAITGVLNSLESGKHVTC